MEIASTTGEMSGRTTITITLSTDDQNAHKVFSQIINSLDTGPDGRIRRRESAKLIALLSLAGWACIASLVVTLSAHF